jgi:alanine racemase
LTGRRHGDGPPLTYVEVDLGAIAHNARAIKRHIGPRVALIAVVKANAYGHGAVEVARTALAHGADRLAVARVGEGVAAPILVMNYATLSDVEAGIAHDLTLTVTEWATAKRVSAQARARRKTARIHVKVDTGMGRFGLLPDEALPFCERLRSLPALEVEGIFSHFAAAAAPDKRYTWEQFRRFKRVLDQLKGAGFRIPLRHIANSAAALDLPKTHLDAVRVGIALYGLRPSAEVEPAVPLRPALALKSRVARVRTLPAGASISYGRTYVTPREMPVALVPVGYGDGYHLCRVLRSSREDSSLRLPIGSHDANLLKSECAGAETEVKPPSAVNRMGSESVRRSPGADARG